MSGGGSPSAAAPAAVSKGAAAAKPVDPQAFASQIRPVFADGRIVGADVSGADAATLARVGLKPTDVVTAINGTPLAQVSNPQALMDQLQNNASIQVTVTRDGRPATLTLSLR
jgi:general secretion pathway protein C